MVPLVALCWLMLALQLDPLIPFIAEPLFNSQGNLSQPWPLEIINFPQFGTSRFINFVPVI